jgi:ABC-type glycerol-3-phosphate transport system substrate-binding protein
MPMPLLRLLRNLCTPLGSLLVATTLAAAWLGVRSEATAAKPITLWTFAQTHADALTNPPTVALSPAAAFQARFGRPLRVQVLGRRALDLRLRVLLAERDPSAALPDLVLLDAESATRLLDDVDAREHLRPIDAAGLDMLPNRLALWRHDGVQRGLPMDVHPTALAYRVDLWQQAGLDPAAAQTWAELADMCRVYTAHHSRPAMELSRLRSDHLTLVLQQAGVGALSTEAADVVLFLARPLADDAAAPVATGHGRWARDLAAGDVGMLWMPDWRVAYLRMAAPDMAGRVAMMPLPAWEAGGVRTAGWGGTMLALTSDDPLAAAAARFVAASPEALAARAATTSILPPIRSQWPTQPVADDYFVTGDPRALYARLADGVKLPRHDAAYLAAAGHLGVVLDRATRQLEQGQDEAAVLEDVRRRLWEATEDVARRASR